LGLSGVRQDYKTFYGRNYVAIGVTSIKITRKYAVNYAVKSFITLGTRVSQSYKTLLHRH